MDYNDESLRQILRLDILLLSEYGWLSIMSKSGTFYIELSHPKLGSYRFNSLHNSLEFVAQIKKDLLKDGIVI